MECHLVLHPEEILRKIAKPVVGFGKELQDLLVQMKTIMCESNGVGIAAPQVNQSLRCFLVHFDDAIYTFINPVLSNFSREMAEYEEGCLSIPGVYADIERPVSLTVNAQNENGKKFEMNVDGFFARIIQHEMDHLEGILFFDHLPRGMQRRLLKLYDEIKETIVSRGDDEDREQF